MNLNEYLVDVKLAQKNFKLYSYSFLCFGTNQILNMYNAKTLRDSNYGNNFLASCYPEGFDTEFTSEEILENPCVNGLIFDQNEDFTIDKNSVGLNQTYIINGNSKKNKCRDEVDRLIPQKACPYGSDQCSFNQVYLPPVLESEFFALGNFFEAFDLTSKLLDVYLNNDMVAFNQSTYNICSMSYSKVISK